MSVTITVEPNEPPTCPATMAFDVYAGASIYIDPVFECLDDGFIVGFEAVEEPVHGTLDVDPLIGGLLSTSPTAGYVGSDTFTLIAEDDGGAFSDPIVVTVTVLPNGVPTCLTPVTVRVPARGRVTLDHRNGCTDPDGDALTPGVVVFPQYGQFEPLPSGLFDFVAKPGFTGRDQFTFHVTDSRGATSNDAVVVLIIGNPAVRPQTQPQTHPQLKLPDVTAPAFELTRAGAQKLGAVRKRGLKLRLVSTEGGVATIELSVTKRTARRYGINRKAKRPVVVGRTTKTLVAGDNAITVRLSKRARRRLASVKRVTISVLVSSRDAAGNTARETLQVKLRR